MPQAWVLDGDCREVLAGAPVESVDAVVTDPPYELAFMGKAWDGSGIANDPKVWQECLRVLKPGGYLLAFGGTRTYHRMVCAVEDAGFEIRDSVHWVYGSGFPKSLNVSEAIDKSAGGVRSVVGRRKMHKLPTINGNYNALGRTVDNYSDDPQRQSVHYEDVTVPATDAAKQWDGWGTALKPAHEPIVLARKPLCGTVAENVLRYGTGAINVDGCRVAGKLGGDPNRFAKTDGGWAVASYSKSLPVVRSEGRWPPNLVLTHDPDCADGCVDVCAVREIDEQSGIQKDGTAVNRNREGYRPHTVYGEARVPSEDAGYGGSGGASRFFPVFRYTAKASRRERPQVEGSAPHPTVKPLDLMRWLVRLVTPPDGVVLDPFAGSGATLEAAVLEGFDSIGIELMPEYRPLIEARLERCGILVGA